MDYYKDRFKQEDLKIHKLQLEGIHPSGKEYYEHDDIVYEGEAPTGQTSTRLLGCLVNEGIVPALEDEEVGTILDSKDTLKRNREDMGSFQDRLRDELYFLGMLEPGAEEPSEIRDELIQTINELKSVVDENRKKKDILIKHAEFHLGYQEYLALLTDVNKTIEQLYIKKFKRSKPSIIKKKPAEREVLKVN